MRAIRKEKRRHFSKNHIVKTQLNPNKTETCELPIRHLKSRRKKEKEKKKKKKEKKKRKKKKRGGGGGGEKKKERKKDADWNGASLEWLRRSTQYCKYAS